MTQVSSVVTAALRKIRVVDATSVPEPYQMSQGIDAMNRMLARWVSNGLLPRWQSVTEPTQTVLLDLDDEDAVILSLSLRLADEYGEEVTPVMVQASSTAVMELWRDRLVPVDSDDSTVGAIIFRALREVSGAGIKRLPDVVSMFSAITALNAMIIRWQANGTQLGFSKVAAIGDEINVPDEAKDAVVSNLAMRLCNEYGVQPTPVMAQVASSTMSDLVRDQFVSTPPRTRGSSSPAPDATWGSGYNVYTDGYR